MIAQLRIDEIHIDLRALDVAALRHLGQRARQIYDGVAAVVLREQEHGEVRARRGGRVLGRGGCGGRRVGREVRGAQGEGGFSGSAEVG
jgi:hypothetical protein